jgi:hypothetical protein
MSITVIDYLYLQSQICTLAKFHILVLCDVLDLFPHDFKNHYFRPGEAQRVFYMHELSPDKKS